MAHGRSKKRKVVHAQPAPASPALEDWWSKQPAHEKQAGGGSSRGRPKAVRKTQSLAHLAAACPDDAAPAAAAAAGDGCEDVGVLGEAVQQLELGDRWELAAWLKGAIMKAVAAKKSSDDHASNQGGWMLDQHKLTGVVYLLHITNDLRVLLHLLLWLLPLAATHHAWARAGSNRNPKAASSMTHFVGEATLLSYLKRYESAVAVMDLLPQAMSAAMQAAAKLKAKGAAARALLSYVAAILSKHGRQASVQLWESRWKASAGADKQVQAELEAAKAATAVVVGGGGGGGGTEDTHASSSHKGLAGRSVRAAGLMKESVQRMLAESTQRLVTRHVREGEEDVVEVTVQTAQRVVCAVVEAMRQVSSGVDPNLLAAAVAAVVASVGNSMGSVLHAFVGSPSLSQPGGAAVWCARHVIHMHILCVSYLKDVFAAEAQHVQRMEVAMVAEAAAMVTSLLNRAPRGHIVLGSAAGADAAAFQARLPLVTAAGTAAFMAAAVVAGVVALERVVWLLKLGEGLQALQRGGRMAVAAEGHVYWFRLLVGNCATLSAGLVAALLGEANTLGLAHLQRAVPLRALLPPAFALFSYYLQQQKQQGHRDDGLLQAAAAAVNDVVAHDPFRELCFRDTGALYSCLVLDAQESEQQEAVLLLPLPARLFLYAVLERRVCECLLGKQGVHGCRLRDRSVCSSSSSHTEEVVKVLDKLEAGTLHWQWVELRLLLNEQVIVEKVEANGSAVEALQAASASPESRQLMECEKTFTELLLTRLLVQPEAAPLYSEVLHRLGKAFEEYLVLQVRWVLEGVDMLFGRKSLRQVLDNYAHRHGSRTMNVSRCEPYGRKGPRLITSASAAPHHHHDTSSSWLLTRKEEEEEEEEEDARKVLRRPGEQQLVIEKALAHMVLPCLVRSSVDACCVFGMELAKQLVNLEQHVCKLGGRSQVSSPSDNAANVDNIATGGSPGVTARKSSSECQPVFGAAIQASVWLRLQFLMPLLPIIQSHADTLRSMQVMLLPVLLRLLDTRVLREPPQQLPLDAADANVDGEWWMSEAASCGAAATAGEWVHQRLLAVLHYISQGIIMMPPVDQEQQQQQQQGEVEQQMPYLLPTAIRALPPPVTSIHAAPPQPTCFSFPSDTPDPSSNSSKMPPPPPDPLVDPWTLLEEAAVGAGASIGSSSDNQLSLKCTPWLKGAIRERRRDPIYVGSFDQDTS